MIIICRSVTELLPFLMSDASRLFRRAFTGESRDLGVTGPQWRTLAVIARNPGINQGTAADLIEVEPISLSRMIDRLGELGLVERRPSPTDRRAWCLYLTDAAVPLVERMRTIARTIAEDGLDGFSEAERTVFSGYLERFHRNLAQRQSENEPTDDTSDGDARSGDRARERRRARA